MKHFARECHRRNLESEHAWSRFAPHREIVTRAIEEVAGTCLCILGAGNCNDLDLRRLTAVFDHIELYDLDDDALHRGVQRQSLGGCDSIVRRGGRDLTGLVELIRERGPDVPVDAEAMLDWLSHPPDLNASNFDCVASVCTLSQLIEMVAQTTNAVDERLHDALLAGRQQHLRLMLSLLNPGGTGLLISDFVSSQTCPELLHLSAEELPAAARRWIGQRNFFTGTNPLAIKRSLEEDFPEVQPGSVRIRPPWKWDLGPRAYAVCAVRFQSRPGTVDA